MNFLLRYFCFLVLIAAFSCKNEESVVFKKQSIAFIADVHLHDIFGDFHDTGYKGIKNPITGEYANIRTMRSQLKSTRIFNENYFAFIAALDDIVEKGIKCVVFPGDFSDDGQPIHLRGFRKILDDYSKKHEVSFFIATGNHDVVKPFTGDNTKTDFLGKGGKNQIITSNKTIEIKDTSQLKPIITSDIKNWGYKEVLNEMADFGFFPKQSYLYWETPFSKYTYSDYSFSKAVETQSLEQRLYTFKNTNISIPDASYLVEPVAGVWLLAIDANVYIPKKERSNQVNNPDDFSSPNVGYNNVLSHKRHLINWVKKIAEKAKKEGKTLIAFSHYPMIDFNDDASTELKHLFGENKMQLHRVPSEEVAKIFADAGLQIHFGGHMHINDTGVRTTKNGNTLYNIQTPTLAAYIPAYKILTLHSKTKLEVKTIVVDSVKNYNSLFPFYEEEYAHLEKIKKTEIWNKNILNAKTYKEFTEWHLKELVRLRFLKKDFPLDFLDTMLKSSGKDLLSLNIKENEISKLKEQLSNKGLTEEEFNSWTGFDMILDFYKLRSVDELAFPDIGINRLKQYQIVCDQLKNSPDKKFVLWSKIFQKTMQGQPSNHFQINLITNKIERINH